MEHARPAGTADLAVVAHLLAAQHADLGPQRGGDLWSATHPPAPVDELAALLDDPAALVLCGTWCDIVVGALTARIVAVPGIGRVCENDQLQTRYGTPAMVAGEGVETDINRCQLRPLRRDYLGDQAEIEAAMAAVAAQGKARPA